MMNKLKKNPLLLLSTVLVIAAVLGSCGSLPINKTYRGQRFPAEFTVVYGNIGITFSGVGKSKIAPSEDTDKILDFLKKRLAENKCGIQFNFPETFSLSVDEMSARSKAIEWLFYDARSNIESGRLTEKNLLSPELQDIFSSPSRYLMLFKYRGVHYTGGAQVLTALFSKQGTVKDDSVLWILLFDNTEKKIIYADYSEIEQAYADPRSDGIIQSHVKDFLDDIKAAQTEKAK